MLTGEQLRAARAMLKVEQGELADLSGVSIDTIKRLERLDGLLPANTRTLDALRRALEADGVIFIPENGGLSGARLRRDPPPNIRSRKPKGQEWQPTFDEEGKLIPIRYSFAASDQNERPIGRDLEISEDEPLPRKRMKDLAAEHAKSVAKENHEFWPWSGWTISVMNIGRYDEPTQDRMYHFVELIPEKQITVMRRSSTT